MGDSWPLGRQRYHQYTRERLQQTLERLYERVHDDRRAPESLAVSPAVGRISPEDAAALTYRPAALGERLGPLWATYWVRVAATVPNEWAGRRVDLLWMTGSESLLWVAGAPIQGLATGDGRDRAIAPLVQEARGGELLQLELELACNGYFGQPSAGRTEEEPARLERCEIARFDAEAWRLLHDFRVLQELEADRASGLDESWAGELLASLNRFCNVWDPDDRGTWSAAGAILEPLLRRRNATRTHELFAIGHGHLDTAWLWPLAETYRKCRRTFTAQLALMRAYPEHRFACSSAQHYAWVKERDPQLYNEIRERVRAGQWVPVGGTWVEADCNLPAGESLVRQFLQGQRFFERELDARCTELWNPDVFGCTNQLPQIMVGAGVTRLLTQKLSWNRFTTLPAHTFRWQGLDGSEVVAHFPPADTYCSPADVAQLRYGARAYRDHDRSRHSLLVFGHGDGGGGPTAEMLETLRRARDLQGVPRTTLASSAEFFDALERDATDLPTIVGELYLEYHRGTYTSQAAMKRGNRRCEAALHDAEFLAAAASRLGRRPYPHERLARLWRLLLLNQFHDVLPGSSIGEVHAEALSQLEDVERAARTIAGAALDDLAVGSESPIPANTIGAEREEVAERPDGSLSYVKAPPYGWGACSAPGAPVRLEATELGFTLANEHLVAGLARDGSLRSLRLRDGGREALAEVGNRLELYDDRPVRYDAWDVDPFHLETGRPCAGAHAAHVVRAEELRGEVAFEREVGARSTMRQVVRLDAGARRIEFHTDVDWHERHRMLKVAFPLAVRAERATYEVAFGYAERPTHFSSDADLARFEVPGHRWADLSEHGFGVALLNDSKYGHSAYGATLRLSLLRAPTHPDPEADQGMHHFTYALMPHHGGWREGGVVHEARRFNAPLLWGAGPAPAQSLASVDDANLVLDTIKCAEDGDALVLRLYEAHGARGVARVRVGLPFASACFADLLEGEGEPASVEEGAVVVPYRPHQILTVLVR